MKKNFFIFSVCLFLFSCSADYDIGESNILEQNRLVVNSLLNPQQPVSIYFYATARTDTGYVFSAAENVKVILEEDGKILFDGVCNDAILQLDYHPKAGSHYAVEASLPGFETVSANAFVPDAIACNVQMNEEGRNAGGDMLITLSEFNLPKNNQAALWVTAYGFFEDTTKQYRELYANNLLVDKINQISGMPVLNPTVGSLYHDAFLRVKNNNLSGLDQLVFTPAYLGYDYGSYNTETEFDPENWETKYDLWNGQKQVGVKLITAGKEYDQYCRTLYLQKSMIIYDDDISAIMYQPVQVYSNIKNGMGIFAGMNETNYYFDLSNE